MRFMVGILKYLESIYNGRNSEINYPNLNSNKFERVMLYDEYNRLQIIINENT